MKSNGPTTNDGMELKQRIVHELKVVGIATLYFGSWLAVLVLIKQLILAEYQIEFYGLSKAVLGALILAKVVIVLEHVSLGDWVRRQPAWVGVTLRTILYALGVLLVILLEKGIEGRHEYDGFIPALRGLFGQTEIYHVWANVIVISGALLVYNLLAVLRLHLGEGGLLQLLTSPIPQDELHRKEFQ